MKLISWNVNGLRACMNKGFDVFLQQADADIFCVILEQRREKRLFRHGGLY